MMQISYSFFHCFLKALQGFHENMSWNHKVNKSFSEGLIHQGDVKFVSYCLTCFMVE